MTDTPEVKVEKSEDGRFLMRAVWRLTDGEVGEAYPFKEASERSIQVSGKFGGGKVVIEGSNEADGAEFASLHESYGADIAFRLPGLLPLAETSGAIRPRVEGGSGVDVVVTLVAALRR